VPKTNVKDWVIMKTITKLLTTAGLAFAFATCASADITWAFNNVNFCYNYGDVGFETDNDITTASFFTTDNTGTTLTGFDITVEGTNTLADNEYTPANSIVIFPDANHLDFYDGTTNQYLNLFLDAPGITSAGGLVNLLTGDLGATSNSTIACNGCSTLVSGSVTGSTVPEPRFGAFLVAGLAGLGFFARRQLAAARS
jgi:hypothetical protein